MTTAHTIATKYLRNEGLNSITWEYFTGDFKSVITYLEKIANHIFDTWKIDHTEIFSNILPKKALKGWDENYLPSNLADNLKFHTHIMMEDTGSDSAYISVVDVDFLKNLECSLHCTIAQQLEV